MPAQEGHAQAVPAREGPAREGPAQTASARYRPPPPGSWWQLAGFGDTSSRITWAVLFALPFAVMVTAASLVPSEAGHGTHTQLGLPPCGFLVVTGIPCPGCGLTTSFSHMIRAQVVGAAHANPFGVLLFLVSFFTIPISAYGFVRRLPVVETLERLHFEKWAILLAVTSILVWVIRSLTILLDL